MLTLDYCLFTGNGCDSLQVHKRTFGAGQDLTVTAGFARLVYIPSPSTLWMLLDYPSATQLFWESPCVFFPQKPFFPLKNCTIYSLSPVEKSRGPMRGCLSSQSECFSRINVNIKVEAIETEKSASTSLNRLAKVVLIDLSENGCTQKIPTGSNVLRLLAINIGDVQCFEASWTIRAVPLHVTTFSPQTHQECEIFKWKWFFTVRLPMTITDSKLTLTISESRWECCIVYTPLNSRFGDGVCTEGFFRLRGETKQAPVRNYLIDTCDTNREFVDRKQIELLSRLNSASSSSLNIYLISWKNQTVYRLSITAMIFWSSSYDESIFPQDYLVEFHRFISLDWSTHLSFDASNDFRDSTESLKKIEGIAPPFWSRSRWKIQPEVR